jgi:hypothetical protein
MEKYQEFNPFKFIIYSGQIGAQLPQLESKQQILPSTSIQQSSSEGWLLKERQAREQRCYALARRRASRAVFC